jgi:hypothetical protein
MGPAGRSGGGRGSEKLVGGFQSVDEGQGDVGSRFADIVVKRCFDILARPDARNHRLHGHEGLRCATRSRRFWK